MKNEKQRREKTSSSQMPARAEKRCLFVICCIILLIVSQFAFPLNVLAEHKKREYAIKAAFIFNFAKFVTWPDEVEKKDRIEMCILGEDPFGREVLSVFEGRKIRGKIFIVKRIKSIDEVQDCCILYISPSEKKRINSILLTVKKKGLPVLTVSDMENFLKYGGMINLYKHQNRIRFEINNAVAVLAGLRISSKLLSLSRPRKDNIH